MTTPINDYQALFDKLLEGSLSREETEKIIALLESDTLDPEMKKIIEAHLQLPVEDHAVDGIILHSLQARLPHILQNEQEKPKIVIFRRTWLKYAAAVVFLIGLAVYLLQEKEKPALTAKANNGDRPVVLPGKDRAVLTLADGREIFLDSAQGSILQEDNLTVVNNNGAVGYEGNVSTVEQHTLRTPRGGQYQLKLPDGTKVWMNAESSISFPTAFIGNNRKVAITGEVYFEVDQNRNKPFIVEINKTTAIQVLGTSFNINSYNDEEAIEATLLEGSIKVVSEEGGVIIAPGQQARVRAQKITVADNIDKSQVIAWKNGLFNFNNSSLPAVMRQLSRWYDVEIQYEGKIPETKFMGKIQRGLNLADVLEGLKTSGVNFIIKNKTIIVRE